MTQPPSLVPPQIEQFVRSKFDIATDDPDFTPDIHLFDYGYVDSFGAQELIHYVEATYRIKIEDDDLVKYPLNTVNEISQFVVDRQAGLR